MSWGCRDSALGRGISHWGHLLHAGAFKGPNTRTPSTACDGNGEREKRKRLVTCGFPAHIALAQLDKYASLAAQNRAGGIRGESGARGRQQAAFPVGGHGIAEDARQLGRTGAARSGAKGRKTKNRSYAAVEAERLWSRKLTALSRPIPVGLGGLSPPVANPSLIVHSCVSLDRYVRMACRMALS